MSKSILKPHRKPGISFILRCRNEEKYIAKSIESLRDLTIPHEIIIILHLCTDNSESVAKKYQAKGYPIRIYKYDQEVSRAGYETLVTPDKHPASLSTYYNFCMSKANYLRVFKWDADFQATKGLIKALNKIDLELTKPTYTKVYVRLGDKWHLEPYMYTALKPYRKYIFWEVPRFPKSAKKDELRGAYIQSLPASVTKSYWHDTPWFLRKDSYDKDLALKYAIVTMLAGREHPGMAKAGNPACVRPFYTVRRYRKLLNKYGINLKR